MERVKYVDIAKFIGIIFVLLDHVQYYVVVSTEFMKMRVVWIGFFLTIFFWTSGLVFSEEPPHNFDDVISFVRKKVQAILVPYVLWCFVLNYSGNHDLFFFKCILVGNVDSLEGVGINSVLWFYPSFFLANVFTYMVVFLGKNIVTSRSKNIFYACCALVLCMMNVLLNCYAFEYLYFGMRSALVGCAFMLLGKVFKSLFEYWYIKLSFGMKIVGGVSLFLIAVPVAVFNMPYYMLEDGRVAYKYDVWMADGYFGRSVLLFLLEGILFCTAIILLSMCLERVKLFSYVGQRTIIFMTMHIMVFSIVALHAPQELEIFFNGGYAINYISFLLCSIVIILALSPLVDAFFPFLYRPCSKIAKKGKE